MLHWESNLGSVTLTETMVCQWAKREGREGRRQGHPAAGKWPKNKCGGGHSKEGGDKRRRGLSPGEAWKPNQGGGRCEEEQQRKMP